MNTLLFIINGMFIIILTACSNINDQKTINNTPSNDKHYTEKLCSVRWYEEVEKKISTSDGNAHGPDLGSTEWRSVIEFRLGIRGSEYIPPLDSEHWCVYIDKHYIN